MKHSDNKCSHSKYSRKTKVIVSAVLSLTVLLTAVTTVITFPQMKTKANYLSIADIQGIVDSLAYEEVVGAEVFEISPKLADAVDRQLEEMESSNRALVGTSSPKDRDWNRYSSDYAQAKMTTAELAFYDRLDSIANHYMTDSAADATYFSAYGFYVISGAKFNDLGLDKTDAFHVAEWFLYNNPQYYFLRPRFLTTSSVFYLGVYDFAASGTERLNITSAMFDQIDVWIASICDDEITTYQKELSAHELICDMLEYDQNDYDQSVYSSVFYQKTVCAGYSELFSIMCNAVDIPCLIALSSNHAWNLVRLDDGQWYSIDLTWNDSLNGHYLFNCGSISMVKYDHSAEHTCGETWLNWIPDLAYEDYVLNTYDTSGSDDPPMTLDSPENIRADYDESTLVVSWDAVPKATDYQVDVYSGSTLIGSLKVQTNSVRINNSSFYQELAIRLKAIAEVDGFSYSSEWIRYDVTAATVPAPYDVTTSISGNSCSIAWCSNGTSLSYEVEIYRDADYTSYLVGTTVRSRRLTLSNVASKAYYGRIRSVNSSGTCSEWTLFGINVKVDTPPVTQPSVTTAPTEDPPVTSATVPAPAAPLTVSAPTGLSSVITSTNTCRVTWDAVKEATGYDVKICLDASGNSQLAFTTVKSTGLSLKNVSSAHDYYVFVRSVRTENGETCYSDWTTVLMSSVEKPAAETTGTNIDKPVNLSMTTAGDGSCSVSWQSNSEASRAEFQISKFGDFSPVLVQTSLHGSKLTLRNLSSSVTYYVRVRFVKIVDEQEYYSDWTVTTFNG